MLLTADTVATGRELLRPGWIQTARSSIVEVGTGPAPGPVDFALGAVTVVPGFVDTHVHGGGGGDFCAADPSATSTAADLHRRHGTTTLVASLVSATPAHLARQVEALADQVLDGLIAGIHLEGPWLAETRCGAHDPTLLRDPDPNEVDRIIRLGNGTIRMVTVAPERSGSLAAIERITDAGVVAAVGHTDATYEQTRAAIDARATVATHLFNAMRPIHHREPGPVIALLEDPRVTIELIADGVHVHGSLYRHVLRSTGPERISLITDAMAAAGMSDGAYRIGALAVEVTAGVARIAGTETIAGSTATMDHVFRNAAAYSGLPPDEALLLAVSQSSVNPARALGLLSPALVAGAAANMVVLDNEFEVTGVVHNGSWVLNPVSPGTN